MSEMPTDVESRFHEAMLTVYRRARAEAHYNATRFLSMVVERGGLATARYLLHAQDVSDGYTALWERQRLDLTVEALILQPEWQSLFSDDERRIAVNRLREYGYSRPLPDVGPTPRAQLDARAPKKQRQHYVPQWILKGFADHNGLLHAWRIREARAFGPTRPNALFAGTNINTALSDDRTEVLAYSEEAHTWMDWYGSRTALAVRDAAREASWSPNNVRVITAPDEKILTWFTGLPVRQIARSPNARRLAKQIADQHQMTSEQTDVMKVESGTARLPETEAYLDTGRPTVLRSSPDDPLIVGDDIVVIGTPSPDGRPSFVGILIDQHTILGRSFAHDRRKLSSTEVEVVVLSANEVMKINRDTAARAETIAGSHKGLVDGLGEMESAQRSSRSGDVPQMVNDDQERRDEIPQILRREISPEKARELVEVLLGGPLMQQSFGWENELVEGEPTGRRRCTLRFETDWLPGDDVDEFASSLAQVMYLGALSNSRYLETVEGPERSCADEWERIAGSGVSARGSVKAVGLSAIAAALNSRKLGRLARAVVKWITDGTFELDTKEPDEH